MRTTRRLTGPMATLCLVRPQEVHAIWPHLFTFLQPAIERSHGRYSEATILRDCLAGQNTLWMITENGPIGALVTEIVTWPTGLREGRFVLAGGSDHKTWMPLLREIERWAQYHGATFMNVSGRPGWEREICKLDGWNKNSVEMVKCLVAPAAGQAGPVVSLIPSEAGTSAAAKKTN